MSLFSCLSNKSNDLEALSFDNQPIHYSVSGRGPLTLIFVHGWATNQNYWDSQVEFFRDKYKVVTLDLVGHGKSGKVRKNWTAENYARDVIAVMNEINSNNLVLIGHDMGDEIILRATRTNPEKVAGIIGVDNFKTIDVLDTDSLQKAEERFFNIMKRNYKLGAEFYVAEYLFSPYSNPSTIKKVIDDVSNVNPKMATETLNYLFQDYKNQKQFLRNIIAPLFLVNSDYVPTDTNALKKYCLKGYDITYIQDIGHFPMLEAPTELNTALQKYLTRIEERLESKD